MLAKLSSYLRRHHIGLLALFVALSGTAYAATLPRNSVGGPQIKSNAVGSAEVKNRALLRRDFKPGQLPRGARGPQGLQGLQGPAGAPGAPGAAGATNVTVRAGAAGARESEAFCAAGERAVGGGGFTDTANSFLYDSSPGQLSGTPTSWFVAAEDTSGADANVEAYVICAAP